MFRLIFRDRKLALLVVMLSGLLALMVVIWRHYDIELKRIDKQKQESAGRSRMGKDLGDGQIFNSK